MRTRLSAPGKTAFVIPARPGMLGLMSSLDIKAGSPVRAFSMFISHRSSSVLSAVQRVAFLPFTFSASYLLQPMPP